jgi:hypothetical protein
MAGSSSTTSTRVTSITQVYKRETNCFPAEIAAIRALRIVTAMKTLMQKVIQALVAARSNAALEHLDERTLRDIGLDTHANIARDRARLAVARLGMY